MTLLYDLFLLLYGLCTLPVLAAKGKLREGAQERQGFLPAGAAERLAGQKTVWIHAVSVGEARLAVRLIRDLAAREPSTAVVLTTTTASAQSIAREAVGREAVVTFCPFDLSWMMRRFLDAVRPSAIVILETEVWPNLLKLAQERGLPVLVVNARLSDRSFPVYRRSRLFVGPTFGRITRCLAQTEEHARRFRAIGVDPAHVRVTGNMKFDLEAPVVSEANRIAMTLFRAGSQALWLAASTHSGEEEQVLEAFQAIRTRLPSVKLTIAPRHLERTASVEKIIRSKGFNCAKISEFKAGRGEPADVLLVDEWGILNQLYALVDAVFVGGSLVPVGGHNLAEPAVAGSPVLYGPWMQNFKDMEEEFRNVNAGIRVADARDLERRIVELFQNPASRQQLAARSRAVVTANAGATDRNLEEILTWSSKR